MFTGFDPNGSTGSLRTICPLCSADNRALRPLRYSRAPWIIQRCPSCAFVYLANPVGYAELVEEFAWERTSPSERKRRDQLEPALHRLSRSFARFRKRCLKRDKLSGLLQKYSGAGRLLDIGCGKGGAFAKAPPDMIPFGIEISGKLSALANEAARSRGGFVIHADALKGLARFHNAAFAAVVLSAFLEHELQPKPVLAEVSRVLRPGGKVIIKVPNFASLNRFVRGRRWCGFRFPDHVNYFTPATLRRIVHDSGLHPKRFWLRDRPPFGDNMWMVAEKISADRAGSASSHD